MINLRMAGRWAASKHLGSSDPFDASGMGPLAQQFNDELGHDRGLPAGTMAAMTPNHQEKIQMAGPNLNLGHMNFLH